MPRAATPTSRALDRPQRPGPLVGPGRCGLIVPTPRRFATLSRARRAILAVALGSLTSCATIPRAAPELSAELASRIQETRASHLRLLRLYLDEKRAAVDRFVNEEWVPRFSKELFDAPAVAAAWEQVVRSTDPAERVRFIAGLGPRLQTRINAKRQELIAPLDEAERDISRKLNDHYDQMVAVNATLTGLLEAGSKATETQQRILKTLDPNNQLPRYVDQVDEITTVILDKTRTAEQQRQKLEELLRKLKEMK